MPFPRKHKYHAKPLEFNGRTYPSTAQAHRAMELDALKKDGEIRDYFEEVWVILGPDERTRVDFMVVGFGSVWFEDVKGMETPRFRKIRKLWEKYARFTLHIIKGKKTDFVVPDYLAS